MVWNLWVMRNHVLNQFKWHLYEDICELITDKYIMKNLIIFFLILACLSCSKDAKIPDGTRLRGPFCIGLMGDKKATLTYFSPYSADKQFNAKILLPYKFVDPDYFEIYQSDGQINNFKEITRLKNDHNYTFTLGGLNNGNAYYFYVVGEKAGYTPLYSDTIMVIPNQKLTFSTLASTKINQTISSLAYSPVANKIAYVDKSYAWNGGANCCMAESVLLSSTDNQESELLTTFSYDPNWSSNGDTIVFAEETQGQGSYSQIALYDLASKAITKLTSDTTYKYNPSFSPSGDKIIFQSNRNRPDINTTNIWSLDLSTLKTELIIDLSKTNFVNASRPLWMNENDFVFQGTKNSRTSIYKYSRQTNGIESLITSKWNDYNASVSPDGSQIAFLSNRSGSEQLWLYNLQSNDYKQLTGYDDSESFDGNWTKINWMNNNQLLFTFGDNRLTKIFLK